MLLASLAPYEENAVLGGSNLPVESLLSKEDVGKRPGASC